jgi:hypothetical protein
MQGDRLICQQVKHLSFERHLLLVELAWLGSPLEYMLAVMSRADEQISAEAEVEALLIYSLQPIIGSEVFDEQRLAL